MIYVVSLPSIESRPTAQWYQWARQYIIENNRKDIMLLGTPQMHTVPSTEFLNYREYFAYVYPQLVAAIKMVKSGDTVFFMDGETAGVEALEYIRKMEGIDIKIRAFWHAGTYEEHDLTALRHVHGEHFERGWFDISDRIFVASEYHKKLLQQERDVPADKITVTGCPLDLRALSDGSKLPKLHKFLFAGRKGVDKGYDIVQNLRGEGVDITVSLDNNWNKAEFYQHLAQSSLLVNPSRHELFGTALMEALGSNVPVIAPELPAFHDVVPQQYLIPMEDFYDKDRFLRHAEAILRSSKEERVIAEPFEFRRVMNRWFE